MRHLTTALVWIVTALALLGPAAPQPAPARPTSVTQISEPTSCSWAAGLLVTFDTGEVVCVGLGINARPSVGPVDSFWRPYWSASFPFYHSAGFTQNGMTDVISFSE